VTAWFMKQRGGFIIGSFILLSAATFCASFLLRFDGVISVDKMQIMLLTMPLMIALKLATYLGFKLHRGLWCHAGVDELTRVIKACSVSSLLFVASAGFIFHFHGFPRSVIIIDWLLSIIVLGGKRMVLRVVREMLATRGRGQGTRTLIVGAGSAGELAARELMTNTALDHEIIGFLDDDPHKLGMMIRGKHVFGTLDDAPRIIKDQSIKVVLLAIPSAGEVVTQRLVESCLSLKVRLQILPAISDLITGRMTAQRIRDVSIEDLLQRETVQLDAAAVSHKFAGKRVLVTGAGGSIGSELARQVAAYAPSQLLLLDMAETPLFEIDAEVAAAYPHVARTAIIANVANAERVDEVFRDYRPECVLHAAAYKHVPLMEGHPEEAVLNNVGGTRTLVEAATTHGVTNFVMISSDKAVRPTNVMGITKRICELIVSASNGNGTCFSSVRFGNVLGSNGSVVPIFRRQIEAGGPVTITHPDMTRYFMTIPEAVSLVLQCGAMSTGGEVFVLDMGKPVKIMDLAKNLIALSGYKAGEDIEIKITGLRPGEKLHEELATYGENLEASTTKGVSRLDKCAGSTDHAHLWKAIACLERKSLGREGDAVREMLRGMMALDEAICTCDTEPCSQTALDAISKGWEQLLDGVVEKC
jgi:FlaA1/EpsC-like NDP-sugar epimerase